MNTRIFAWALFLAVFVAAMGAAHADDVAVSVESDATETETTDDVPVLYLFVVDPEGELSFEGTVAPEEPINLRVSAYDATEDVHLVSVRSTRVSYNQTETNLGNLSGGEELELAGPWDEDGYVFFWAWTEHEGKVVVSSVCKVYVTTEDVADL